VANSWLYESEEQRRQREPSIFEVLAKRIIERHKQALVAADITVDPRDIAWRKQQEKQRAQTAKWQEGGLPKLAQRPGYVDEGRPLLVREAVGGLQRAAAQGVIPTAAAMPEVARGVGEWAITPRMTEQQYEQIHGVPVVGPIAAPHLAGLTSPLGTYATALMPQLTAGMVAGGVAGGVAGKGLEAAGVPVADVGPVRVGPSGVLETAGMLAGPAAIPALERAAMRGVAQLPTAARAGAERVMPTVRRLAVEEIGGPKPKLGRPLNVAETKELKELTAVAFKERTAAQQNRLTKLAMREGWARREAPTAPPAPKPAAPKAPAQIPKPTTRVSRPRPTGEVPPTEPPKPPKPPKGKGPPPEEPSGELLARFLEGHHDVQAAKADWAKFQGGLALRGKQIDIWMKEGSSRAKIPTGGERTPEMEQLYKALHGEGRPPAKYQSVYDDVEPFMREQERRLLADVPEFEQRMLKDPTYFTRKWRNWEIFEDIAREAKGQPTRGPAKPGRRVGMPGQVPKVIPRRTMPRTFSEALEVGGEPLTWNPYEMAAIHAAELEEYRFVAVLIQAWKAQGRTLPVSQAPRSWETPPYKAFQGKPYTRQPKVVEGAVEEPVGIRWSEPLAVSPEDNKMLPHILGFGFEGFENSAAYVTSVFKRAKVLFGLFQYWDLQNRTLLRAASQAVKLAAKGDLVGAAAEARAIPAAAKAWQGAFYPPARNRLWKQLLNDPEIAMAIEEGGLPIGGLDVWKRTMRSSLEPDLVMKAPIIGEIPTARLPMGLRQATEGTQKVMNGMYRYVASGLYDSAHPQYWSAFYKSIFKELRAKYPQMAERQVAAQAAKETNVLMSSIPDWHSVLNPRLRQLGRGVAFSVNEGEAWMRMIPRAIRGKNPELYRQQWAAYLLGALTFAEVVNYAMTGEPLTVNQLSPIVMRDGKPTYNSNFARPRLDGDGPIGKHLNLEAPLGRHIYLDFMGQADTPFRMLNPQFFVMTRLSPQLSVFIQELQEKRFFGQQELNSLQEKVLFAGEQLLAPIPLVGFGQERERIGNVGAIIQATGWNVSSERLGELFARRYKEETGREWDETTVIQRREDVAAHPKLQEIKAERLERGLEYGSAFSERTAYMDNLKTQQKEAILESLRTDPTGAKAAELVKESKAQRAQTWQVLSDSLGLDGQAPKESEVLPDFYADKYMAVEREMDVFGQSTDEEWERYEVEQQQILQEAKAAGVDVNYIKKRATTFWDDPQLDLIETYYQQAKESMREYQAIPRFIGVPDDLAKRAEAILQQAQAMVATQGVPLDHAIAVVGKDDPQAAMIAAMESRLRNPMRTLFWKQHPELSVFWGRGAPAYLTPEAVGV